MPSAAFGGMGQGGFTRELMVDVEHVFDQYDLFKLKVARKGYQVARANTPRRTDRLYKGWGVSYNSLDTSQRGVPTFAQGAGGRFTRWQRMFLFNAEDYAFYVEQGNNGRPGKFMARKAREAMNSMREEARAR